MKTRIITALVAICVLVPILFLAKTVVFPIAVAICAGLAVFEMLRCIGLGKSFVVSVPFYLIAAGFPFVIRYLHENHLDLVKEIAFAAVILTALYLFVILTFSHGKYDLRQIGTAYLSVFYVLLGFNAILVIHDIPTGGEYLYLVTFIGAWITDIFAYFCGMLLGRGGKHKLLPDVSPKKTIEGSIGGIVFCVIAMVLFGLIVDRFSSFSSTDLWIFAIAGLPISVVAQVGDLSLSVIKRTYGVKDYGKIFPGHGGMLDRFDSVIAVSTVLLVITTFVDFFV